MPGKPAARLSDFHICPMQTPAIIPVPHVGGPITSPCSPNVLVGGPFQARISDLATCVVGPLDVITQGAITVLVQGLYAARMGDMTAHGGVIAIGQLNVLIGGPTFTARPIQRVFRLRFGLPPWEWQMQYGESIFIRPDPDDPTYQSRALAAVIRLDTTDTMHRAFDEVEASGHTITIQNYRPGPGDDPYNAYCQSHDINAALTPGEGSDSTVTWNPDINGFGPAGTTPDNQQPGSDIILGHEMIHGTHNATGEHGDNWHNDVAVDEERNTVGLPNQNYNWPGDSYDGTALPDTTGEPYTENQLRGEYRNRGIDSPTTGNPPESRPSYYSNSPPVF